MYFIRYFVGRMNVEISGTIKAALRLSIQILETQTQRKFGLSCQFLDYSILCCFYVQFIFLRRAYCHAHSFDIFLGSFYFTACFVNFYQ